MDAFPTAMITPRPSVSLCIPQATSRKDRESIGTDPDDDDDDDDDDNGAGASAGDGDGAGAGAGAGDDDEGEWPRRSSSTRVTEKGSPRTRTVAEWRTWVKCEVRVRVRVTGVWVTGVRVTGVWVTGVRVRVTGVRIKG